MNGFYGECLRLEIFGQSHAESIGMTLEGVPAGARMDLDALLRFMQRRAPGRSEYATARREADVPEFTSGLCGGVTDGTGRFTVGGEVFILSEGETLIMPKNIPHAVYGEERFKMQLIVSF